MENYECFKIMDYMLLANGLRFWPQNRYQRCVNFLFRLAFIVFNYWRLIYYIIDLRLEKSQINTLVWLLYYGICIISHHYTLFHEKQIKANREKEQALKDKLEKQSEDTRIA